MISQGCDLYYEYYERAAHDAPILLIHPAGATASTWGPALDRLTNLGPVIAYDRRGYARTGGPPRCSMETHTRDAVTLLEHLGVPPAAIVGTSAGAAIAVNLAVRRPDLVRVVVAHEFPWQLTRHLPTRSQIITGAKMTALVLSGRPVVAADVLLRAAYAYRGGGSAWDAFPEEWRQIARDNAKPTLADFRNSIRNCPTGVELAAINTPVFCTYGARSPTWMVRLVQMLGASIPAGKTLEIEGAGHAAPFDAPDRFVDVVSDALNL